MAGHLPPPLHVGSRRYTTHMNSTAKSWLVTSAFALAGIIAVFFYSIVSPFLLPHVIIYSILVINTFFSIRFWSAFQPKDARQLLIDAVLVVTYFTLAFSIGEPVYFALAALLLFIAAPLKYILMRGRTSHEALVEHKILLDSLGTLACISLVVGLFLGYPLEVTWLFALGFTLANLYLLFIRPMYRM